MKTKSIDQNQLHVNVGTVYSHRFHIDMSGYGYYRQIQYLTVIYHLSNIGSFKHS